MKQFTLAVGMSIGLLGMALTSQTQAQAQAQKSQPVPQPIPPGALLNRAPEFSSWTMSISLPQSASQGGKAKRADLQQLVVTKTKNIYREERQFSDGTKQVTWRVGALQISSMPGTGKLAIFEPSPVALATVDPEAYTDYSKTDFPGLEWISKRNYVGVQTVMDKQCLVFQAMVNDVSDEAMKAEAAMAGDDTNAEETPQPKPPRSRSASAAWIDLETRLPVALQKGEKKVAFRFGEPPQTMLTLPPDMQNLLERRAKFLEMTTRRPARPY